MKTRNTSNQKATRQQRVNLRIASPLDDPTGLTVRTLQPGGSAARSRACPLPPGVGVPLALVGEQALGFLRGGTTVGTDMGIGQLVDTGGAMQRTEQWGLLATLPPLTYGWFGEISHRNGKGVSSG